MESMERLVTNLELSKELEALGVKQESAFYWWELKDYLDQHELVLKNHNQVNGKNGKGKYSNGTKWEEKVYSAFSCGELGEMLPAINFIGTQKNNDLEWEAIYTYEEKEEDLEDVLTETIELRETAKTEADARGKMLKYLWENGLINKEVK